MSCGEERKRRSQALAEEISGSSPVLTATANDISRTGGLLQSIRPFSTESARRVRCRVTLHQRVKSNPSPSTSTASPRSLPSCSLSPVLRPTQSSSKPDMGQTPMTAPAQRLMNYLQSEWGDNPNPGPSNTTTVAPETLPTPPNQHNPSDILPLKRYHSPDGPVDLTHSPESASRPRRLRLRLNHQDARKTSPAPIRVPPPGDSSEDDGDAAADVNPSAPPLVREGSGGSRESRGKRPLQEDGDVDMEVTYGTAGPAHAKRSRISYAQYGAADSPTTDDSDTPLADRISRPRQVSGPPFPRAHLHTPPRSLSTPTAITTAAPSGSFPAGATTSFPAAGATNAAQPVVNAAALKFSHTGAAQGGLQNFVADLLSQLPSSSNMQEHGALLNNMLQGNIGIKPQLAAVQQALAALSDTIDDKTEQLMSSYAELLQQYLVKEQEAESMQATLREREVQLAERENTIQQLQAALSSAQAGSAASASAVTAAQREAELSKEAFQQEVLCQICFENRKSVLLMPCLHFLYCQDCVSRCFQQSNTRTCPTCRTAVAGTMNVHLQA